MIIRSANPIGMRIQKIAGHPNSSPITPPPRAPVKVPAPIAANVNPRALPRREGPNARAIKAGARVKRIATPIPCGIRKATIGVREFWKDMIATAAVYSKMPAESGHLIPNLSAMPPAIKPNPLLAPW